MMIALLAVLLTQAAVQTPPGGEFNGTAGVCVRWGSDPRRVEEAVVVAPSGNPVLDAALPETIRNMQWPRPERDSGAWIGISMAVGDVPAGAGAPRLPDCSGLRNHSRAPAPYAPPTS